MKSLREATQEYIRLRRSLGYTLIDAASLLKHFASFMERERARYISTELALRWARQPANVLPSEWGRRLSVVRRFAEYARSMDRRNEVPPRGLLAHGYRRRNPYIYSDEEVARLLDACTSLSSANGLRSHTYYTVFGLLAASGMRISELVALGRDDVDLSQGIVRVRDSKFHKSRLVPLHDSTVQALLRYAGRRDRVHPRRTTSSRFFLSEHGAPLSPSAVRVTFVRLSRRIGLRKPTDSHGPRIHDLRHRFAVKTITDWYRTGVDVERNIPLLSTYLGHAKPSDTYWYLSSIPELIGLAAERLEKHLGGAS